MNRSFDMDRIGCLVIAYDERSCIYRTDCHSLVYDGVDHDDGKMAQNYLSHRCMAG